MLALRASLRLAVPRAALPPSLSPLSLSLSFSAAPWAVTCAPSSSNPCTPRGLRESSVTRQPQHDAWHRPTSSSPAPCGGSRASRWFAASASAASASASSAAGAGEGDAARLPSRLAQKQKFLEEKLGEALSEEELNAPIPQIREEHVTVAFARSGGPGGQNVNKVNTKVDMRFNVFTAEWLPERIRLKILDEEANRINSDGEVVVSSTRTRTQKGNIQDALEKLQKIIDKAAYVPPPPSAEKQAKIRKLAKAENERRLESKKMKSSKKSDRRSKGSWD